MAGLIPAPKLQNKYITPSSRYISAALSYLFELWDKTFFPQTEFPILILLMVLP